MRVPATISVWRDEKGKDSVLLTRDSIAVDGDREGRLWPTVQLNDACVSPGVGFSCFGGFDGDIRIEIRVPDMRPEASSRRFDRWIDQEIGL